MSSPPTTLGQYQIIREIARSNDIVYEAYDPLMNRRVAIKELSMPGGSTPQQREERTSRFRREAQAAGTLSHPNIMTVFSFAEDAGRFFMAMEYLDGTTLRSEIDTKGFLPVERAIEIAIEVLSGLEHAHSKGVIHRDIKPDNVQILSNGQIKITDFGIARLTFQPNLTMDGQVFGTPSYMSPEQVVGKDIDARSDLFSLGVMLYEMICGQKPFAGDSVVSITYAIMNKEPQQPAQADWKLWSVIAKALEKTPAMRYASAADMIAALRDVLNPNSPFLPDASAYGAFNQVAPPPVIPGAFGTTGGTVSTQPYNPYQNLPVPNATPGVYTQPYAQNSPGAGGPNSYPYGASPAFPPPIPGATPVPVYYPPPARRPLLTEDQTIFVKRFLMFVLLIGTLVVLLLVGLQSFATVSQREHDKELDAKLPPELIQADPKLSVDQNIANLEQGRSRALDDDTKSQIGHRLAGLYTTQGAQFAEGDNYPRAEDSLQRAAEVDPNDPTAHSYLGQCYLQRALVQPDAQERQTLLRNAANELTTAASGESNQQTAAQDRQLAAKAYFNYASSKVQSEPTQRNEIHQALLSAKSNADPGTELEGQIRELLAQYP